MVNFYIKRIQNGYMSVDQVPARWRALVEEELEKKAVSQETAND